MTERRLYDFGRFRLDGGERVLSRDGQPVALPPKDLDTLLVLVENRGHIVEKEELLRRVWPDAFVEEGNLARRISNLRSVLGDNGDGQHFIDTVPKRGYRFVATVVESAGSADLAAKEASESSASRPVAEGVASPMERRLAWKWYAAVAAMVLAGAASGYRFWRGAPPVTPRRIMVAILPVDNMSGSAEYDYVT